MNNKPRTNQQNAALHLLFRQIADELNASGFDVRATLKKDFELIWTQHLVKELLWRPVQKIVCGKKSTTQINTEEINQIFDIINKALSERTGVSFIFPSIESLMQDDLEK